MTPARCIRLILLFISSAGAMWSQPLMWEAHVLRADSLFRETPRDTAAILNALLDSESEWYTVRTDTGVAKVLNPVGEPLWFEGAEININERLIHRTLELRRALLGENHQHLARSLERVGMLDVRYSRFDEALRIFEKALSIYEATLGPNNSELGRTLHCLGFLHRYQYRFEQAEQYLKRSLRVREEGLPPDHPLTSFSMNGLAHLYWNLGRYYEAEQLYKRAYQIRAKAYGPSETNAVMTLSNLIRLYLTQGRIPETERILSEHAFEPNTLLLYYAQATEKSSDLGRMADAKRLASETIEVFTRQFGERSPMTGQAYFLLARVYHLVENYPEAEKAYSQSMQIVQEQSDLAAGIDLEVVKMNLADLLCRQSRVLEAAPLYDDVVRVRERNFGLSHPLLAEALEARSRCNVLRRRYGPALRDASQALTIRRDHYEKSFAVLAEHEALSTITLLRASLSNFLSCFLQSPPHDPAMQQFAADAFFSVKGRVSDGIIRRKQHAGQLPDSSQSILHNRYMLTKCSLSNLYSRGSSGPTSHTYRRQLDSLTECLRDVESELARMSGEFRGSLSDRDVTADRILASLPPEGTLIEYLRYRRFDPNSRVQADHYLAVLLAGESEIGIRELGPAREIDSLIGRYKNHFLTVAAKNSPDGTDEIRYEAIAHALFKRIWEPLVPDISARNGVVFIAPDGPLHLISFAALVDARHRFLIERYRMQYLPGGRDLLHPPSPAGGATGLLAFGDPDYDAPVEVRIPADRSIVPLTGSSAFTHALHNLRSGCAALDEINLPALNGTAQEVLSIRNHWQTTRSEPSDVLLGASASEENLKRRAPGRRVIHIATHGYYIGDECGTRASAASETPAAENPLLRSGVFLAGANLHGKDADSLGADDGILTALEVSALDLRGTDLVVLSACETGLGKVEQGEGVYGLRRAFQMAGARTVVSSLWQIPDDEAVKFMKTLYSTRAKTYPELMQQVALKRINEARLRGRPAHPFAWGAFVATGDWRVR